MRLVKLAFALVLVAAAAGAWFAWLMLAPAGSGPPRVFDVASGTSPSGLAQDLEDQKIIRSAQAFRVLLRATRFGNLHAGRYKIGPAMSPYEIVKALEEGPLKTPAVSVTFPEGKTLREIAAILESKTHLSGRDFQSIAQTPWRLSIYDKHKWLPKDRTAEGFLFPDTYQVPEDATATQVLDMMLGRFEQLVLPEMKGSNRPLTDLPAVVTLASLVEAEAQVAAERPRIAGVYTNRLERDMLLECDATVQYALGKRKPVLLYEDLEIESPYNTYKHKGLPPGPIANPGLASIKAALEPEHHDFLFYVRNDVRNDGSHVFSRTYAEHDEAIRRYQR